MKNSKNKKILHLIGLGSVVLGFGVLLGWVLDIEFLKTILPYHASMKFNTACCFVSSGGALLFYIHYKGKAMFVALSIFTALLGLVSLSQDIFGYNLGIDELIVADLVALDVGDVWPGRPSPTTSFCFSLLGLAFLTIDLSGARIKVIRQYALHLITLISFISILGYLFDVSPKNKLSIFTSMAIHTSLTFFILSIGLSLIQPKIGITSLFTQKRIGDTIARNLFIRILCAVLILGFLQLRLESLNVISIQFGVALFSASFLLVALYVLWSSAQHLNQMDAKRHSAEKKLMATNKSLEKIVQKRTAYLTRQNKQLEDFAHIVSHNLRGPVSNLKSLMHIYKEEETMADKDIIMDKFDTTTYNLESTLNELLEVVSIRHESKKDTEELVFNNVFSKLIDTYQGKIMETKAEVTSDFSAVSSIKYSSVYLESIMQNLLSNALKYRSVERMPRIHFKSFRKGKDTFLKVIDNGLGIDLAVHGNRLFGLHKTFHKHPEAKGVGLFITKAQVEAMGGEISVQSQVNKGTTFIVAF